MDTRVLQVKLRNFAVERNWQQFHNPKNLVSALSVEAAELVEIFQWMTPAQSEQSHCDPSIKEKIADELADVMLYLLQIADYTHIDLDSAVERKIDKNAIKYALS